MRRGNEDFSYSDEGQYDPRASRKIVKSRVPTNFSDEEAKLFETLTESEFTPGEALFIVARWRSANVFAESEQ